MKRPSEYEVEARPGKRPAQETPAESLQVREPRAPDGEGEPGQDPREEELAAYGVPSGWTRCPKMGGALAGLVAMKVPLSGKFDPVILPEERFGVEQAGELAFTTHGAPVGLIIDLSKSTRYYDPRRWLEAGVQYVKIPCAGRGKAPEPEAVNDFCFEVNQFLRAHQREAEGGGGGALPPPPLMLVHCTHGFNRSGFMICSYLIRSMGVPVWKAVRDFAAARPPGIYKPYYVRALFDYYHEEIPAKFPLPTTPAWKGGESDDEDDGEGEGEGNGEGEGEGAPADGGQGPASPGPMEHDDVIGEQVSMDEQSWVTGIILDLVKGPGASASGKIWFPGSQPVSLAQGNVGLLTRRRYWVTWKADGTRFLLLVLRGGCYLVDRKLLVRRLQLRFPMALDRAAEAAAGAAPGHPASRMAPQQDMTLMDGEMVVDEDATTGAKSRRFLAYDLVALQGRGLVDAPWKTRYALLQSAVMAPRQREREAFVSGRPGAYRYDYSKEAIRVRRKEFWPLASSKTLLERFIPSLPHESDGLIFQGYEDPYVIGTCEELLKWKFPHLNSVDFRLRVAPAGARRGPAEGDEAGPGDASGRGGPSGGGDGASDDGQAAADRVEPRASLELLETRRDAPRQRGFHALPGARVVLPPSLVPSPEALNLHIVECTWVPEARAWRFLRERRDKDTPNAYHVFEKVRDSILDPVTDSELLARIREAVNGPAYEGDRRKKPAA